MPLAASSLAALALIVSVELASAGPAVVSVAPALQAVSIPATAHIVIEFDVALNPATVIPANLSVWGHWSGMMGGQHVLENGGTRWKFVPEQPFSAGELVTVFLSRHVQDSGCQPMARGYSWTYWVRTSPGTLLLQEVQRIPIYGPNEASIQPYGAHGADLNQDGHLDLAIPTGTTHDLRVFLNDGFGGYGPWTTHPIPTGALPSANEAVDLNGDGHLDFAVANNGGDSVSVFIGFGDGNFEPVRNYQAAANVRGLSVADVDGDGDIDIVTANLNGNNISILRNNGDGTFAPRTNIEANVALERTCAVADADGDGILDLFVGSHGSDELSLLLGDGNGSFAFSSKVPAGGTPWMIAVGDLNGDGHADVVSANSFNHNASVIFGDGQGGLSAAVVYPTGSFPVAIDLGDIDGDGDLDLVTSNGGSGSWTVYENNGQGVLTNPGTLPGAVAAACGTLYDYDNDGDLDLAGIDESDDLIIVFRNGLPAADVSVGERPASVELAQNRPNPFGPTTKFRFRIPSEGRVTLRVYDLAGRVVGTLVDEDLDPGTHERTFDCRGISGGVYHYALSAGGRVYTKRMVILK